ncbi:SDR family NAD(P)-dependent oxidoreductase [Brucella gallinifaecis]|uniref:SDR family NAD(P)-dependent oxidoreductase n=1 Tax=Brucella gallinifaecis TaxID=215590 RepID=UPI002361BB7A|nr:SDR family NAD(P)-dependent oxidoreductase [Brucella gallinifaecis]
MTSRLAEKIIFVAGGGGLEAGTIGRTSAETYARNGAAVFVADINEEAAKATVDAIVAAGGRAQYGVGDLSRQNDVKTLVEEATDHFGRIDGLHNNIAVTRTGSPPELSIDEWNESWNVNVTSVFLTAKFVLPLMERQGGGAIVNISSVASSRYLGIPYHAYYATKAAVTQFTRTLAVEYATRGIRINSVSPGFILTPNTYAFREEHNAQDQVMSVTTKRPEQAPMRRMGSPADVANAALFLLSKEAAYITGADIAVDGGLAATAVLHPS